MSKTCSFIKAGAILGGTVIVTAAVAPLFLPNQNVKPLTSAQAAEITAQTMNSKCADCHKPGTHISELVNTLSGGLLARHIRDGQRSYNMEEPPTAVTLSKLEFHAPHFLHHGALGQHAHSPGEKRHAPVDQG